MYWIPGSQWVYYQKQLHVVKQLPECLWGQINGLEAIKSWKQRWNYSKAIWESIDWDALASAYKEVSSEKCRWASKWTLGHFSHGKNMACWQFWSSSVACPCCRHDLEDKVHVIQCSDPDAERVWEASTKQLQEWLLLMTQSNQKAWASLEETNDPNRLTETLWKPSSKDWKTGVILPTQPPQRTLQQKDGWTKIKLVGKGCWMAG